MIQTITLQIIYWTILLPHTREIHHHYKELPDLMQNHQYKQGLKYKSHFMMQNLQYMVHIHFHGQMGAP